MKNLEQQETLSISEIPTDLFMDIFSRAPTKTIGKSRCVSKQWESILCGPEFTDLFFSTRRPPLLLFTIEKKGNTFFFSSSHPQDPHDETTSSLVPSRYRVQYKSSPKDFLSDVSSPLRGFICRQDKGSLGSILICNPVTGQSESLPKLELKINSGITPFLGYDPSNKQLKVLCIHSNSSSNTCDEHQVLTLEDGNRRLWRRVQCKPHYPKSKGICIDGILYYAAGFDFDIMVSMVVCFDVRSEKFGFISIDDDDECISMTHSCTLINYKGRLGALHFKFLVPRCLELYVLRDADKSLWSKDFYTLPPLWNNIFERIRYAIVGMTTEGEVVLAPFIYRSSSLNIYYFNLETKRLSRVQIQGLEPLPTTLDIFLDYAENLKFV